MRCSITLAIISAITLSAARLIPGANNLAQHKPDVLLLRSRAVRNSGRLEARSPEPGATISTPRKKQNKSQQPSLGISMIQATSRIRPAIGEMRQPDRQATISRLESKYGLKSVTLPPARRTQPVPEFEIGGPTWAVTRGRPGPGHSSRVAAYEKAGGQPHGSSTSRASSASSSKRTQQSTSPAEAQVRYDVLAAKPGDPDYVHPSAFRASRVRKMPEISIPAKAAPREREHWSGFSDSDHRDPGCFGCFGLFR